MSIFESSSKETIIYSTIPALVLFAGTNYYWYKKFNQLEADTGASDLQTIRIEQETQKRHLTSVIQLSHVHNHNFAAMMDEMKKMQEEIKMLKREVQELRKTESNPIARVAAKGKKVEKEEKVEEKEKEDEAEDEELQADMDAF